ncbi:MAG TPA: PIG-L family deacetylase [Chthoniobacterales bacterium]
MTPAFDSETRLMLIAPHPDDESVACGVILQRAVQAGAAIRVIYATDGDNNPWPQRVLQRKWRLDELDRRRWGQLRRQEALDALSVMGIRQCDTSFLQLPDQGLTDLLMRDCESILGLFAGVISDWTPTHLLLPSLADTHPDHNALAVMLNLVLRNLPPYDLPMSVLSFVTHGRRSALSDRSTCLRQTPRETAIKLAAISCHKTQLKLSRGRFVGYAGRPEYFSVAGLDEAGVGPIHSASRSSSRLELELRPAATPFFWMQPRLLILGHRPRGDIAALIMPLSFPSHPVELFDYKSGLHLGSALCRGNRFSIVKITIPLDTFSIEHELFVKLDRRAIFFDEAGWLEIPPLTVATHSNAARLLEAASVAVS